MEPRQRTPAEEARRARDPLDPPADPLGPDDHRLGADDPLGGQEGAYGSRERAAPPRSSGLDPAALFVLLDSMRRAVPKELDQQLTGLIREFLLTLRSLIDWYLERLDQPTREPEVEEIPID